MIAHDDLYATLLSQVARDGFSPPGSVAWRTLGKHALPIEQLALPGEAAAARDRRNQWAEAYAPETPGQYAAIEQAVSATLEIDRCRKVRATMQAAKVRTAIQKFDHDQEDLVTRLCLKLDEQPYLSRQALLRFAAGVRYMIGQWRELEGELERQGTWFGSHRHFAVRLQGYKSLWPDLYHEEDAYYTSLHCMALQPTITDIDISNITHVYAVPKHLQDQGVKLWKPDAEDSRCYLHSLLSRELDMLEPLEEKLRVTYEEPARAEAVDQALARISKEESALLRELRSHEGALQQAIKRLEEGRRRNH
jgi:hypothetical protein